MAACWTRFRCRFLINVLRADALSQHTTQLLSEMSFMFAAARASRVAAAARAHAFTNLGDSLSSSSLLACQTRLPIILFIIGRADEFRLLVVSFFYSTNIRIYGLSAYDVCVLFRCACMMC